MTLPIKYFDSTMQGAPQLTNDWGAMTALLDACLVNGFNLKTCTITSAAGIATATVSAGHLYWVNQVLLISGAAEAAYNGEVKVLTTTSTTFTFAVSGSPASPATGTISCKAAPLGWAIAFSGTNKRAYRSANVLSNRAYLRVDDGLDAAYTTTYAKKAKVTMAQGMSDINTFVGARAPYDSAAPTKNEVGTGSGTSAYDGWYKWYYARAAANAADTSAPAAYNRAWSLVGDDRGFYIFNEMDSGSQVRGGRCFTDFESYRSGDGFNTLLCAQDTYGIASSAMSTMGSVGSEGYNTADAGVRFVRSLEPTGKILMRNYTQVGSNVGANFFSLNAINGQVVSGYSTGINWPNGSDYSLVLAPVYIMESTQLRGKMPGMFWVMNNSPGFNHLDVVTGVTGYPGRTFMLFKVAHGVSGSAAITAMLAFDITGPWW